MLTKLQDGFEIEVKDGILDDWDFLEMLNEIDEGQGGKIVTVAKMMLGEDGVGKLKEHCKTDGKVPVEKMVTALTQLFESLGEAKNS